MNAKRFMYIPLTIIALVASSSAFARMDMDSRVSQLETEMHQASTENSMGTFGANTASARADVDGNGWSLSGAALFWRASVGGTEYAYTDADLAGNAVRIKGRNKHIDFDTDWGLRFGLGYNAIHDGWDVLLQYTWFDTNGSDSTRAGPNSSVVQSRAWERIRSTAHFTHCGSAKSMYNFDYQSLNLELGRSYFISSKLSLRPHIGLKSAWIDQSQITRYTDGDLAANTVHVKDDSDFWGLGPRFGSDSKWHLTNGFSVVGNIAAALLCGHFDVDHNERFSAVKINRIRLHDNQHAFSPMVQMKLGLHYDKYLNDNKQHVGVGIGYEAEYWWRQNQIFQLDQTPTFFQFEHASEDVSMHGLTIDLKLDF